MSFSLSTGLINQMLNSIRGAVDATKSLEHGIIHVMSGSRPASPDAAVTGTLLLKITVGSGAFSFGSATNGLDFDAAAADVLSKATAEGWSGVGLAPGTAGWARHMGNATDDLGISTTLPRIDMTVASSATTDALVLSNLVIATGATVTVDSYSLSGAALA